MLLPKAWLYLRFSSRLICSTFLQTCRLVVALSKSHSIFGRRVAKAFEQLTSLEDCRTTRRLRGADCLAGLVILCITPCLISIHSLAQTPKENQDTSPAQDTQPNKHSNWNWSFSIRNRTGFRTDEPRVFQMSRTILDAKGIYRINDNWRMTLEGRAHYDPVERLGYPRNVWLDPRQMLLDGKVKKVDLKLGLQQVVWG